MRAISLPVVVLLTGCGLEHPDAVPADASDPPLVDVPFVVDLAVVEDAGAPPADVVTAADVPSPPPVDVSAPADVAGCPVGPRPGRAGDVSLTIRSGGRDRRVHVHVPASYDGTRATPVVLNLHGLLGTGASQAGTTDMVAASDRRGFIAVHPDGFGTSWNAGNCCAPADATQVNDVAFLADTLNRLEQDWCVDRRREYVAGFSNGGMMSHRVACALSDRVAAVASVSGVIMTAPCAPLRPIPVLHIHGDRDLVVPWNGNPLLRQTPVMETVRGWEERDGCTDPAPALTHDQGSVRCTARRRCRGESEVQLCAVSGGGHSWPRSPFDATSYVLDFFDRHPLP